MCIAAVRGTGIKTQARCIRKSLQLHSVLTAAIDVGSYHDEAPRCPICRPQTGETPSSHYGCACPGAIDLDNRLHTAVIYEVTSLTSCIEFAEGSKLAVRILQGKKTR